MCIAYAFETAVEPEHAARHCARDARERGMLHSASTNRIEVGKIERVGRAVVGKRGGDVGGIVTRAKLRDDRAVVRALTFYGAHHDAAGEIDDWDEFHGAGQK